MDPFTNHSDSPLVTAQLMMHEGDYALAARAFASIINQGLPPRQLEIQLVFDGQPSAAAAEEISRFTHELLGDHEYWVNEYDNPSQTGYYCGPRNRALPHAWGFYIAHMDADNEWAPGHLRGLLEAIRSPQGDQGWPNFVYSRRRYVVDDTVAPAEAERLPTGDSPLREWTPENIAPLISSPYRNFIDTGDFLIGKSALYELAERTGSVWNSNLTRFGDWDLISRAAQAGLRGHAVDQVTHLYHWRGGNLQLTRPVSDFVTIPVEIYERLRSEGKIKDD